MDENIIGSLSNIISPSQKVFALIFTDKRIVMIKVMGTKERIIKAAEAALALGGAGVLVRKMYDLIDTNTKALISSLQNDKDIDQLISSDKDNLSILIDQLIKFKIDFQVSWSPVEIITNNKTYNYHVDLDPVKHDTDVFTNIVDNYIKIIKAALPISKLEIRDK